MLERVFEIGKQARLVNKLRRLQTDRVRAEFFFRQFGDRLEQDKRHILADDCRRLKQSFLVRRQPVDARGQHRMYSGRHRVLSQWARKTILAALAQQNFCFDQSPDAFLQEKRIALGTLDQNLLQRLQAFVVSQIPLRSNSSALSRANGSIRSWL